MDSVDTARTKPEPQPWRSREDRRGWRVIGRGRGVGAPPPLITVEVALDAAQSQWVEAAAERAGLDYESYIKSLIDAARAANGQAPKKRAARKAGSR
jgi:hypothetical protein